MEAISLNNRLVLETYTKEGLRAEVTSGFARISQKNKSKGLKLLITAKTSDGTFWPKGSIAYIREEVLHTAAWATKPLESEAVEGPYLVVDMAFVDYIVTPASVISSGDIIVLDDNSGSITLRTGEDTGI